MSMPPCPRPRPPRTALVLLVALLIEPPRAAAGFLLVGRGSGGRPRHLHRERCRRPPRAVSVSDAEDTTGGNDGGSARAPPVSGFQVCDGVFSPAACEVLRCLAVEGTVRRNSDATVLFVRPPSNATALTPLEHALDSALAALGDDSATVEYWYRDEHMNLDAHVDLDEVRFEETLEMGRGDPDLTTPAASHVLYLRVREDLLGQAPTALFPGAGRANGHGHGHGDEDDGEALPAQSGREAASVSAAAVDLVTVPAVRGRLLRFPGDVLHAVPCPADRWLLGAEDERTLRHEEMLEEEMGEEEEDYDADDADDIDDWDDADDWDDGDDGNDGDDADGDEVERAVLLFNTWPDGPPSSGHAMDYADDDGETERERAVAEWTEDYGVDAALLRCRPRAQWQIQALERPKRAAAVAAGQRPSSAEDDDDDDDDGMATSRIHLMQRSALPEEPWLVRAHEESMRRALGQRRDPTWLSFPQ